MRAILILATVSACTGAPPPTAVPEPAPKQQPAAPASAPVAGDERRWVFREQSSGLESNNEGVKTWILDARAGTVDATVRSRHRPPRGRDPLPWTDGAPAHWKLVATRDAAMRLTLTADDGKATTYACERAEVDVAPATAMRVSAGSGGEGDWKRGRWKDPTERVAMDVCRVEGDASSGLPSPLWLAPAPLEHVVADDGCCGDTPSLRFVPADGSLVPPRDASFN